MRAALSSIKVKDGGQGLFLLTHAFGREAATAIGWEIFQANERGADLSISHLT